MMTIQNPHDKFFKETFSNVDVSKDFFLNYLPPPIVNLIDLESIELQKDSFISKDLREYFSDLLFHLQLNENEGYLYVLLEHKSYPSKMVAVQLLRYLVEIWEAKLNKEHAPKLPIVIPVVIFHSEREWGASKSLGEMLQGFDQLPENIQQYVPNFEYILIDVSNYRDEEIKGIAQLKVILTIYRDLTTKSEKNLRKALKRSLYYLQQLEDQETAIQYLETLIHYIFHLDRQLTKKDFHDIIEYVEGTYFERSEMVMSLAELFRDEGRQQGKLEGKTEALANTTIRLITKFVAPVPEELQQAIYKQDNETLESIIDQIDAFTTIDQIKQYMN